MQHCVGKTQIKTPNQGFSFWSDFPRELHSLLISLGFLLCESTSSFIESDNKAVGKIHAEEITRESSSLELNSYQHMLCGSFPNFA